MSRTGLRLRTRLRMGRQPRAGYPLIVLIADGWTKDVFLKALANGELPDIQERMIDPGHLLTDVVSNLPSVSIASHTSILTSSYQDEHHIPGHRWWSDHSTIRNYLRIAGPRDVNADLSPAVRTIFESHPGALGVSIQGVVTRGAQLSLRLPTLRSKPLLGLTSRIATRYPNSVIVTWLPRGDAISHVYGPMSPKVRADMQDTSQAIGEMLDKLSHARLLDDARILLIPDHGHRTVTTRVRLEDVAKSCHMVLDVNPRARSARRRRSLALTSGDSAAYLYLTQADLERRDFIARRCATHPAVELVCWLDTDGAAHFASQTGEGIARPLSLDRISYSWQGQQDPLSVSVCVAEIELDISSPLVGPDVPYPDIIHQFLRSNVPGRSGDLLILASDGVHFGRGPRLGWRLGFHRGSHGGASAEEVVVAAAFRGTLAEIIDGPVRSADLLARLGLLRGVAGERSASRASAVRRPGG